MSEKWMIRGIVCILVGIPFCVFVAPLGMLLVCAGCILMFMYGGSSSRSQVVTYHTETHDQHVHMHHHHYPVQSTVEGHEYSQESPDGTIQTVRYLRRSE
jgi:hypothetical protein